MKYNKKYSLHQTWDLLLALSEFDQAVYWFTTVDGVGESQRAWKGYRKAKKNLEGELKKYYTFKDIKEWSEKHGYKV